MHNIVNETLMEKYWELGGRIFADYMLRVKGSDKMKKTIQANDFLTNIMEGQYKTEWKLEDTQDFQDLVAIAEALDVLRKEKTKNV